MFCTNCGTQFEGSFCPNCGTPAAQSNNFTNIHKSNEQATDSQIPNSPKTFPPKILIIAGGIIAVICILAFFLISKNSKTKSGNPSEEPMKIQSNLNDSNSSVISFHDMSFRIPSRFELNTEQSTDDSLLFYDYYNGNAILLGLQRTASTISDTEFQTSQEKYADNYEKGFLNAIGDLISSDQKNLVTIANQNALWYHSEGKINNTNATVENAIYQYNGNLYSITLGKANSISLDLVSVFKDIIGSVKIKETSDTSSSNVPSTKDDNSQNIRPEIKQAIDSYASFMNEYVTFMKKYKSNPSDISLLSSYSTYMTKYADMINKINDLKNKNLTSSETVYYTEVTLDVEKKLLEVLK